MSKRVKIVTIETVPEGCDMAQAEEDETAAECRRLEAIRIETKRQCRREWM